MRPVIVVSGYTMGLGVVRSLGRQGVPVVLAHYDERDIAQVSRFVTTTIRVPHPEHHTADFIEQLLGCADLYPRAVIMPASDEALTVLAQHKTELERHFTMACPDWEVTRRCIDKKLTSAVAASCGVPAPRTLLPTTWEETRACATEVEFPCLVKPCQSHLFYEHFKRKMFAVATPAELLEVCERAGAAGLEVMIQEFIPGNDSEVVNYNAYAWEGEVLTEFTAVHVRNAPPWFGSPRVVVSREISEVMEPGRRLLGALGFSGYACTEFKRDPRNGIYKLMEVNARHNLSTRLAIDCGIDFPWLQYRHLVDGVPPSALPYRKEVYWIDLVRDIGYSARYLRQEHYPLSAYLRPYLHAHVFAIFDWQDPRPFSRRLAFLARQGMTALGNVVRPRSGRPEAVSLHKIAGHPL